MRGWVKPGQDGVLDRFTNQLNSTTINSYRYKSCEFSCENQKLVLYLSQSLEMNPRLAGLWRRGAMKKEMRLSRFA